MQTTLVTQPPPGAASARSKTTLYVGGLADGVTEAVLHAVVLPFGEVKDVTIPLDHTTGTHRGFGIVEFEEAGDAAAAMENLDGGELCGRVLRVNHARPLAGRGGGGAGGGKAWADEDDWQAGEEADRAAAAEAAEAEAEAARARAEAAAAAGG